MLPDGLQYVDSWVEVNHRRCFQLMECDDMRRFQQWVACWHDLVDFEIVAVHKSEDVAAVYEAELTVKEARSPNQTGGSAG
jgi:hypothetical protein